jgi:hypothetical protein
MSKWFVHVPRCGAHNHSIYAIHTEDGEKPRAHNSKNVINVVALAKNIFVGKTVASEGFRILKRCERFVEAKNAKL